MAAGGERGPRGRRVPAIAYGVDRRGVLQIAEPEGRSGPAARFPSPVWMVLKISAVGYGGQSRYVIGTSDGRTIPLEMTFDGSSSRCGGPHRDAAPRLWRLLHRSTRREAADSDPGLRCSRRPGPSSIAQVGPTELVVQTTVEKKALIGPSTREESRQTLRLEIDGEITKLALDGRAEDLFIGTSRGQVVRYDMRDPTNPARVETTDVAGWPWRSRHGAGLPDRRPDARRRRRVRRGLDLAGHSAAGRRRAAPDPDLRVPAAQGGRPRHQSRRSARRASRPQMRPARCTSTTAPRVRPLLS